MHACQKSKIKNNGFTLIELLVSLVVLMSLVGIGVAGYNRFNDKQKTKQAILNLKNNLRLAQSKAVSSVKKNCNTAAKKLSGYSLEITRPVTYKIYEKCSDGTSIEDSSYTLPSPLEFHLVSCTSVEFSSIGNLATVTCPPMATDQWLVITNPIYSSPDLIYNIIISSSGEISGPN